MQGVQAECPRVFFQRECWCPPPLPGCLGAGMGRWKMPASVGLRPASCCWGPSPVGHPRPMQRRHRYPSTPSAFRSSPAWSKPAGPKSPWTTWGPGEPLMESQPREPSLPGVRGHGGSASKERSNFGGIELRAQGKATAGCWECKAEAQEACRLKWQSLSADSQPAARSSTCRGGREFGEDSWRGARRPVNLRLCSIPPGSPARPSIRQLNPPGSAQTPALMPPGHRCHTSRPSQR